MDHQVDTVPLDELMRYPRNPKDHDIGGIVESLETFGYVAPIIVNRQTQMILAGHGRLDSLWEMFNSDPAAPPQRIERAGGKWTVPVVLVDLPEQHHAAYVLADNRHTERGGWDEALLYEVLADLATADLLAGTGYDGDDVDEIRSRLDPGLFIDGSVAGADARNNNNMQRINTGPGEVVRLICGEILVTIHRELHDELWKLLEPAEDRREVLEAILTRGLRDA